MSEINYQEQLPAEPDWMNEVVTVEGKYRSYLHRTAHELVNQILESGLQGGADLKSTAHALDDELSALHMLQSSHINIPNPDMAGLVLRIPDVIFRVAKKRQQEFGKRPPSGGSLLDQFAQTPNLTVDEILRNELGEKGEVKIPREWIYAVADQRDLKQPLQYNQYYGQQNERIDAILEKFQQELGENGTESDEDTEDLENEDLYGLYELNQDDSKAVLAYLKSETGRLSNKLEPFQIKLAFKDAQNDNKNELPIALTDYARTQIEKYGMDLPEYSYRAIPVHNGEMIDVNSLIENGGKSNLDDGFGTWVGYDDKVIQKIEGAASTGEQCILVIYNDSMLTPLDSEEAGGDYMASTSEKTNRRKNPC